MWPEFAFTIFLGSKSLILYCIGCVQLQLIMSVGNKVWNIQKWSLCYMWVWNGNEFWKLCVLAKKKMNTPIIIECFNGAKMFKYCLISDLRACTLAWFNPLSQNVEHLPFDQTPVWIFSSDQMPVWTQSFNLP